jgi:hypothetical protein
MLSNTMRNPPNGEPVNGDTPLDRIGRLFPRTNKSEYENEHDPERERWRRDDNDF